MTRTRYGLAIVLQSFGLFRKMKRMTDAAAELHLMQEGEELLGIACWDKIEGIEELSMEYWNIRKIENKAAELNEKLTVSEETLHQAQQQRATLTDQNKDLGQELFYQREDIFVAMEQLNTSRDEVMEEAMAVKRRFEALKTKLSVLKKEGEKEQNNITKTSSEIDSLRSHFSSLKEQISDTDRQLEEKQKQLQELQNVIDEKNQDNKSDASEVYARISQANREISSTRAKLGLMMEERGQLCRQVGRHLNLHAKNRQCQEACKNHRDLLQQIGLLRRSIQWNKKLIERAGG